MDPFRDRIAVITGGAGGIGMAMARAFATRGAKIVLADLDEAALRKSIMELQGAGATVVGVPTDVTRLESVQALAAASRRHFGGAHIICNNAGVATFGEIRQSTHRDWAFTMNVNFWGVVHGVETFVPLLVEQGQGGHIVNTASMAGGTIAAEEVARRVVRAIERRDFYILTHPEQREILRKRAARLDAMF